jgi:hypothetical protein
MNAFMPRWAGAVGAGPASAPRAVVHDERYAESRAFAETAGAAGAALRSLRGGDVTDVFTELDALWRGQPAAVAGSTQFGPMFVLERLGAERGLRPAIRVEHRARPDGSLAHVMLAPARVVGIADQLASLGMAWPAIMAALVCRCDAPTAPLRSATLVTPGPAPTLSADAAASESPIHYYTPCAVQQGHDVPHDGPLYSWLLAPSPRAASFASFG